MHVYNILAVMDASSVILEPELLYKCKHGQLLKLLQLIVFMQDLMDVYQPSDDNYRLEYRLYIYLQSNIVRCMDMHSLFLK